MSGLCRLQLRQLARTARLSYSAPATPVASTSYVAPAAPLQLVRHLSVSTALNGKGGGGREFKVKKAPKGKEAKGGKGKGKAVEEDEEEEDDDDWSSSSSSTKKAPRHAKEADGSEVIDAEVAKAEDKMKKAVSWFVEKYTESVSRVRGVVSVGALDGIKAPISKDGEEAPINQLAAISVKGAALVVDVFDADHTKAVEAAIHKANIKGMSPNRVNARQIRIGVGKPSDKERQELVKGFSSLSEQAKTTVRTARSAGLKVTGKDGTEDLQAVHDKYIKEIDNVLKKAKADLTN